MPFNPQNQYPRLASHPFEKKGSFWTQDIVKIWEYAGQRGVTIMTVREFMKSVRGEEI